MRHLLQYLKVFILAVLFSLSLGFAANQNNQEFLFVQMAKRAVLKANPGDNNSFQLVLKKTNPYVTYFSDRPSRTTGILSLKEFLRFWGKGKETFGVDVPNASLVAIKKHLYKKNEQVNYIVELEQPSYDAVKDTLTYNIKFLNGNWEKLPNLSKYDYIALFIDNVCLSCM